MKRTQSTERARFRIGDRVVYRKFFEYPGRGFEAHERQQIEALAIGEHIAIRDVVIERIDDKKDDTAEVYGLLAGATAFLAQVFWLARAAWHAMFSHGWLYVVSSKMIVFFESNLLLPLADAGMRANGVEPPNALQIALSLILILAIGLCICAVTARWTGSFVAQSVESMMNGESTSSRCAAILDIVVPVFAVIAFMLCRSSGFSLQASLFGTAGVIGIGLFVTHRLTRHRRPRA